ncbi:winged helix-turn-helix transcriptional regulator [Marinicellulosiphila megalodicopiae]|uniref:winged helix-turn-helix transcriptional regulator n=1 Tax=Marinicellulosiphila megalodicopiae TaxID=2724896 RepID=UPI003BB0F03F
MQPTNQKVSNSDLKPCDDQCPIKLCATLIEKKWTTLIIRELARGEKRYFEIEAALYSISAKVLSERLRHLESLGVIDRQVFNTIPPSTCYSLSALGFDFLPVLSAMAQFGEKLKN